jgi:cobalamin biosynthetic protein CobC
MTVSPATEPGISHGGRLEAMKLAYPNAFVPWIDLSTGINPTPYPVPALPPDCFTRLPEPEAVARLETIAAHAYGATDPAMVVAAPGTQILIDLLPRLLAHPTVAILGPTYGEHAAAWARAGSSVTALHDLGDYTNQTALVLCNPNNPDGRITPPTALLDLATRTRTLIVDEAFADLSPAGTSIVPHFTAAHPSLIILRSFGKTYGLAGIRLGFAIAAPPMAATIRAALGAWAVSGPAIAIGTAALADDTWRDAARNRLTAATAALDQILTSAGMTIVGGTPLFRLASTPQAPHLFERLAQAGIMTRKFAAEPHWLRLGIPGTTAATARLIAALNDHQS